MERRPMIDVDYIIRSIGERTEEVCAELVDLQRQPCEKVTILREPTHARAIGKTIATGMKSSAEWVIVLDADMLLLPGGMSQVRKELALCDASVFFLDAAVFDKLFRIKRVGVKAYRRATLGKIYEVFNEIKDEPNLKIEKAMLKRFRERNRELTMAFPESTVALHDFHQYYKDLYRKTYLYATRTPAWNKGARKLWGKWANKDSDYLVMLKGLEDAQNEKRQLSNSVKDFDPEEIEERIKKLGLTEKGPLHWKNFIEKRLTISMETEIRSHEENGVFKDFFPSPEPSQLNKLKALLIKWFPDSLHAQYLRIKAYIKKV